jgi:pyruvate dehydrogenase E1 component alpha subunit
MRGIDIAAILKEFLGLNDGLCSGYGGHMHLFSKDHLIASSGIVGASAPAATGFALAGQKLRPGTISVAFFGEGAMNEGAVLESFNLASTWNLPVLFVCKDNDWSITTVSSSVTAGNLIERALAFNIRSYEIDGSNLEDVWYTARNAIQKMREKNQPCFIQAHCIHLEGHFLGDPLMEIMRHPFEKSKKIAPPLLKSALKLKGGSVKKRLEGLKTVSSNITKSSKEHLWKPDDPLIKSKELLKQKNISTVKIEQVISSKIDMILHDVLSSGRQE